MKRLKYRGKQQKSGIMHSASSDKDENSRKETAMKAMRQVMMIVLSHLAPVEVEKKKKMKKKKKN